MPSGLPKEKCLRWDTKKLHAALNAQRQDRHMTWSQVGQEIGGFTGGMLMNLSKGGRVGFPGVMRLVRWLDQPAAAFTRVAGAWGHWGPEDRQPGVPQRSTRVSLTPALEKRHSLDGQE